MAIGQDFPALRRLVWVVVALFCVVLLGVVGYVWLEGWSVSDALYMTIITLTTVGFHEVHPLDGGGRVFTMILVVVGVAVALVGITLTAVVLTESELGGRTRRRRMRRRIEDLRDHFIVCAYGRVGRAASRELEAAHLPFVVLDPKEDLRERMEEDGVPFMVEDPSLEPILRSAGIERARGLICAVDSDATNVYITLTARQLNPDIFIVARASEPGSAERLERAGADRVVSPFVSSGRHMVRMAKDPSILDIFDEGSMGESSIDIEERVIEPGSGLVGRAVSEAPGTVLALRRVDGAVEAGPDPSSTFSEGDVVLMLRDGRLG